MQWRVLVLGIKEQGSRFLRVQSDLIKGCPACAESSPQLVWNYSMGVKDSPRPRCCVVVGTGPAGTK